MVEALDLAIASGDETEGVVELGEVLRPHGDVELAKAIWAEAELTAGETPALNAAVFLKVAEIGIDVLAKLEVPAAFA